MNAGMTRRSFIGTVFAAAAAAALEEKTVDGGFKEIAEPGVPVRTHPLFPPGSRGRRAFASRCVSCQLCVKACPNKVLRRGNAKNAFRPEMGFEKGWCRPGCVKCSQVCPAGAIRGITPAEKKNIHAGTAAWNKDACVAARDGVHCTVCSRHCPQGAITLIALDPADKDGVKVPVVDAAKCTGCGACEHLCPARPMPAMVVNGLEEHRETVPVGVSARIVLPDGHPSLKLV